MSAGGSTWGTAGALEVGNTNTFTRTDTVAGPDSPYWPAFWVYTAAADVNVTVDTYQSVAEVGGDPDTVLYVYSGGTSVADATVLSYNDDNGSGSLSSADFHLASGQSVHIQCGAYDSSGSHVQQYVINVTVSAAPIPGPAPVYAVNGATLPAGECAIADAPLVTEYCVTAPAAG